MDRLTNIGSNGEIWITDNDETRRIGRKESAYKKLAEYEDLEELIGINLKEIAEIFSQNIPEDCKNPRKAIVLTDDCVDKWNEYKNAEEQGLLLRLPCKIGTSVYMVAQDCGGDALDCMRGDCEGCPYLYSFVEENQFEAYMLEGIGKTVFLTQAEAEKKLKEMESD